VADDIADARQVLRPPVGAREKIADPAERAARLVDVVARRDQHELGPVPLDGRVEVHVHVQHLAPQAIAHVLVGDRHPVADDPHVAHQRRQQRRVGEEILREGVEP